MPVMVLPVVSMVAPRALVKRTHSGRVCVGRSGVKEADHRHSRLLRARDNPPRCGATE
jgi:hypothetical protein